MSGYGKTIVVILVVFSWPAYEYAAENNNGSLTLSGKYRIAQVDDTSIDIEDFKNYLGSRPLPEDSSAIEKTVTTRLEEFIANEVLCEEALRIGLDKRPEVRLQIERILTQALVEEKVNKSVYEQKITDVELQAYYDQHISEFKRLPQVRLADIFISVARDAGADERTRRKEKAEKVLTDVLAHQDERLAFGRRILKYSDIPEKYARGNTGFFDVKGQPVGLDSALAEEAFKLAHVGQICNKLIAATDGYHIIMLTGRRGPVDRSFKDVKEHLRQQIYHRRIELAQKQYIDGLQQKCRIIINRDVLGELIEEQVAKIKTLEAGHRGGFPAFPHAATAETAKPGGRR